MDKIDMHIHTTASDGQFTPTEIVRMANIVGLSAIAITDHDTVQGIEEATEEGNQLGIKVIPGVELSTLYDGQEIHILGYFIRTEDEELQKLLVKQRDIRRLRNEMLINKLDELGIKISLHEAALIAKSDANIGRPHIAQVLINRGIVDSIDEAFAQLLGRGGRAYVTPDRISPFEAINFLKNHGAISIIAHPGIYNNDELIKRLITHGVNGIEINHPDHDQDDLVKYKQLAKQYDLLQTGGSDFHGERDGRSFHGAMGKFTVSLNELERKMSISG